MPIRTVFLVAVVVIPCLALYQNETDPEADREAQIQRFREQLADLENRIPEIHTRIKEEIDALDKRLSRDRDYALAFPWAEEWAGAYYDGDGLGVNRTILIAPENGLLYTWYGCLGLYDANSGPIVRFDDDSLFVSPAIDPTTAELCFLSERIYLVRWGLCHYLVPEERMLDFCNDYNQQRNTPWFFGYPLREKDKGLDRRGVPEVPTEYARFLLREPISAEIVELSEPQECENACGNSLAIVEVALDAGRDKDIYLGMTWNIGWNDGLAHQGSLTITEVYENTSKGRLVMWENLKKAVLPKVGDTIWSTSTPPDATLDD
ncbi:MAG: hypothetical protein H6810_05065 [Phycisphaeraceae bacterium]|nr:MAG: hypothetical protein H6810_05065 [Phycisphaeraceae bacterium]